MKKSIKIKEHLTNTDIYVCYGNDEYLKVAKKLKYKNPHTLGAGLTVSFDKYHIVVVADDFKNKICCKSCMVHELNHSTSFIMDYHNINDDEFRSCLIAYLYEKVMPWLDECLSLDNI